MCFKTHCCPEGGGRRRRRRRREEALGKPLMVSVFRLTTQPGSQDS